MAKTIRLEYGGTPYTLEFTRAAVAKLENEGVTLSAIESKPMNTLTQLFRGAFWAHHRNLRAQTIDEIFAKTPNKEALFQRLVEMFAEPANALFDEPEENEGNATWDASNW